MTYETQQVLKRAITVLPATSDELLLRGITAETTDRIVTLKRTELRLRSRYGSLQDLETRIATEGVPLDDHTLYTDLLEWRALRQEMIELLSLLEMM